MAELWSNWSGSLKFRPGRLLEPSGEDEFLSILQNALETNQKLRAVGAGHSSSPSGSY
jgi:FAD/FMN-containing dehydrogenase